MKFRISVPKGYFYSVCGSEFGKMTWFGKERSMKCIGAVSGGLSCVLRPIYISFKYS